jgi:hypothetical protein
MTGGPVAGGLSRFLAFFADDAMDTSFVFLFDFFFLELFLVVKE